MNAVFDGLVSGGATVKDLDTALWGKKSAASLSCWTPKKRLKSLIYDNRRSFCRYRQKRVPI
jgi:hypothetical protein